MPIITDLLNQAAAAAADAQAKAGEAQAGANIANITPDTPAGQCLEGFNVLAQARDKAALAHEATGKAEAALDALNLINVDPLVAHPTAAQLTTAQTNVTTATNAAAAADAAVAAAEPVVRQNFVNCLGPVASQDLINCLNDAKTALQSATTQVTASDTFGPASLTNVVQHLIDRASAQPVPPSCNQGLELLAEAQALVNNALGRAADLQSCLNRPDANPALPIVGQALAALSTAQGLVTQAADKLRSDSATIQIIWMQRYLCRVPFQQISVHVTDESGDNMGGGVTVSLDHHAMITALQFAGLPIPSGFPLAIPALLTDPNGRVSFSVPCPPVPDDNQDHPAAPPLAPAAPGNLPMFPSGAVLVFNATHPNRPASSAAPMVNSNGLITGTEVQIPVPATSL